MKLFDSFYEWRLCVRDAAVHIARGLWMTARVLIMGLASLLRAIWRLLVRWVGSYPNIALGGFLVASLLIWMVTFMLMRARAVGAEEQRDSIAWQYIQFKEQHGYE